jgi:hypothetical protein
VLSDAGQPLPVPAGFHDEAGHCLAVTDLDHCLVMLRPGEYPALTGAAVDLLRDSFFAKDGVRPESFDRHLASLEPQIFCLLLRRGPNGPVPVGAAQLAINERHPPESITDIQAVFGVDVADLCAHTTMPSGRTMPNLLRQFRDVAGFEAVAIRPEYRLSRAAPYAMLLYTQVTRYLIARGNIKLVTAILDMRPGEVFSQLQTVLRGAFNLYGRPIPPRVYWAEGQWAHLSNHVVPVGAEGQPLVAVPNYSAPAYIDLLTWLDRLRGGDAKERLTYRRIVGDGLAGYAAFDPSFELEPMLTA